MPSRTLTPTPTPTPADRRPAIGDGLVSAGSHPPSLPRPARLTQNALAAAVAALAEAQGMPAWLFEATRAASAEAAEALALLLPWPGDEAPGASSVPAGAVPAPA